jgi:hypothetical protein
MKDIAQIYKALLDGKTVTHKQFPDWKVYLWEGKLLSNSGTIPCFDNPANWEITSNIQEDINSEKVWYEEDLSKGVLSKVKKYSYSCPQVAVIIEFRENMFLPFISKNSCFSEAEPILGTPEEMARQVREITLNEIRQILEQTCFN